MLVNAHAIRYPSWSNIVPYICPHPNVHVHVSRSAVAGKRKRVNRAPNTILYVRHLSPAQNAVFATSITERSE